MIRGITSDYPKVCGCGARIEPGTRYFSEQHGLDEDIVCLACHEEQLEAQARGMVAGGGAGVS